MKCILLIIFLLAVPSVSGLPVVEYIKSFDVDYGDETTNNTLWGGSDYRLLGTVATISVDSKACGGLGYCPGGYSFLGEQLIEAVCNDGNKYMEISKEVDLNFDTLYGSVVKFHSYKNSADSGSYKFGICQTGLGCTYTSWYTVFPTAQDNPKSFNIPEHFPDILTDVPGMSEIDKLVLRTSPYKGGCSGTKTLQMTFWNISLIYDSHVPTKTKVWDGTNSQWLEDARVVINGTDNFDGLTDSNGIAHDNEWMENGSYTYSMTKDGYYPLSGSWNLQPCVVVIGETDTYTEYASNCGPEDLPMYEIPVGAIDYNIEVVDILNKPVNNSFITLKQSQFPYAFVSDYTDENGLVTFNLGTLSTYDYTVFKTDFEQLAGSFSTNLSNITRKFVLLQFGCAPVISATPTAWSISITNFSFSHTQEFCYELEHTNNLISYIWSLDGNTYAYNYPCIEVTFEETGDRQVSMRSKQTDCVDIWGWEIHLTDTEIPEGLQPFTTETHYTKQEFLNLLKYFVPVLFPIILVLTLYKLIKRIGRKSKES